MKKCAGIILGLAMVFAFLPMTGFAADAGASEQEQMGPPLEEVYEQLGGVDIISQLPDGVELAGEQADADREAAKADTAVGSDQDAAANADTAAGKRAKAARGASARGASKVDPRKYTYTITPLLEPFNEYFFVKTDNPDPKSFRFADKSSKYSKESAISLDWDDYEEVMRPYADIRYENEETCRVNGGYIFYSGDTDGGELTLQRVINPDSWDSSWSDTNITVTLPKVKDCVDYLIDTYAVKSSFFDNMDAVQSGFSSICLYSGSYVRGRVERTGDYWSMGTGHIDQGLYIYSPFSRLDSRSLFASAIYPFRFDSLGFPSVMAEVSKRLDSSSSYEWDDYYHANIHVTYNGETRIYGGAGNGEGQGISEDKILQYFSFGQGGTQITLDGSRDLLRQYAAIEMDDDIPRDDELTWKQLFDTVGGGAWGRLGDDYYIYLYPKGKGDDFSAEEWGVGYSIYWGGDLGYARDCWVDGRYVTKYKVWQQGVKFEDEPTADIILKDFTVPKITYNYSYEWNEQTGKYESVYTVKSITEEIKTVRFYHGDNGWTPAYGTFGGGYADYEKIKNLVQQGKLDQKYLDMVTLTEDEVRAMQLDRNTNNVPDKGYIYDGYYPAGTPFDESAGHCWGGPQTVKEPGCETPGQKRVKCLVCGQKKTMEIPATGHKWGEVKYGITKDYSKIVASRTCEYDSSHVEKETKATTKIITKEATCEAPGEVIYRAVFDNPAFGPARRVLEIPALGHSWDKGVIAVYPTADADGTRTFTCGNCGNSRIETIPRDVDEITPSDAMAEAAAVEESVPVVSAAKIQTTGNITKKQMKVKFPAGSGVDNYLIQYRLKGQSSWKEGWSKGKDTFVISGLKKSSLCEFRIAGFVKGWDGVWVRGAWSKVSYRYMSAVSLKSAKAGKKQMTVSWAKDKKASGYQVQYSLKKNMSGAKTKTVNGASKTKCTIKKLKSGKKYYVKVRPIKKSGKTYVGILSNAKAVKVR